MASTRARGRGHFPRHPYYPPAPPVEILTIQGPAAAAALPGLPAAGLPPLGHLAAGSFPPGALAPGPPSPPHLSKSLKKVPKNVPKKKKY